LSKNEIKSLLTVNETVRVPTKSLLPDFRAREGDGKGYYKWHLFENELSVQLKVATRLEAINLNFLTNKQ